MKKIIFLSILFLFCYSSTYADGKVYFLDVNYILNNSISGKKVVQKLKDINSKNISDYKIKEKELADLENKINKIKNIISENELKNKIENLKKEINSYRKFKDKTKSEYNIFKEKELQTFFIKITPYIEEFMKKNSIDIVLDKKNIFIANSKYDITEDLIKFLNEKS